ncbi:hypothetical protein AB4269_23685, partial [Vibrio splendidus]
MINKKSKFVLFLTLFFCFSFNSIAETVRVTHVSPPTFECISVGMVVDISTISSSCSGSESSSNRGYILLGLLHNGRYLKARIKSVSGKTYYSNSYATISASSCVLPKEINESTGVCEDRCKKMEGEKLGSVSFPEGTRDVVNTCANSCRAKSDLFFPAANPPYGVFTYTGDSCDGSESSGGGETGGGETGGGETGGGETGGGETGGGETGGG